MAFSNASNKIIKIIALEKRDSQKRDLRTPGGQNFVSSINKSVIIATTCIKQNTVFLLKKSLN